MNTSQKDLIKGEMYPIEKQHFSCLRFDDNQGGATEVRAWIQARMDNSTPKKILS